MKLATFNINGIRSRLPALLEWLERESPDIACLQELKAPDSGFPEAEINRAGYGAIWHGQMSWNGVAILAKNSQPVETRRGLPGDPDDTHSRYLEAAVEGILVGCLYLPNGNPQPGPKFDYKLAWFERLIIYAKKLLDSGHPVVLAGDYNVVPTDFDIYNPRSWLKDALLQPESRECYARLLEQGWTDALRARFPDQQVFTFWDYFRQHWERNSGLRIDHLLLSKQVAGKMRDAGVDRWVRGVPHASDHAPAWVELDIGGRAAHGKDAAHREAPAGRDVLKKSAGKQSTGKQSAAKQSTGKQSAGKESAANRTAEAQTAARPKAVKRTAAKQSAMKKTAAKKTATQKPPAANPRATPSPRAASSLKTAK